MSCQYGVRDFAALRLAWKQRPCAFRELHDRVFEEHCVEHPLHAVTGLLKTGKRIGVSRWWLGIDDVIRQHRIEGAVIQRRYLLTFDADALQARSFR